MAVSCRRAHAERNQPYTTQHSDLSDLQKLVKDARRTIVDPILSQLAHDAALSFQSDCEMDEEDEIDPEESKRERERAKIRELKKRKITCGLTIPSRSRTVNAVFIRRDLEDESAEVDISLDDPSAYPAPGELTVNPSPEVDIDSHPSSAQTTATSLPFIRQSRIRQPSTKLRARENADLHSFAASGQKKGRRKITHGTTAAPIPELSVLKSATEEEAPVGEPRGAGKPKPETYKQAWSVSEQHLLERLLEEIPDGEKNR